MAQARFAQTKKSTFYGEYIYDQVVPKDHFFRKLNERLDWPKYSQKMMRWYKGGGEYGRPPFDPVVLLKMLLVAYLYNLSESQAEAYINDSMSVKYFLGLGMDQPAPDHSTLTKFKERMLQRKRMLKLERLADIVQTALRKGIRFGSIQVVDSTRSVAHVNTTKEGQREKQGKGPTDPDARWGCKGKQNMRGPGSTNTTRKKHIYGYKAYMSMNSQKHLITSVITTTGQAADEGHYIQPLIKADVHKQVPVGIVSADRGYDDSRTNYWLERTGIQSAICLKDNRTLKKVSNKQVWLELQANPTYQAGLKERYKIERKFGEGKQGHGLGSCRYRGLARYEVQVYLTAMALNPKRMVKLLYGVNFRNPVAVMA